MNLNILFCINDFFSMPCGVLITSILKNNNADFHFHVISKYISEKNQGLLKNCLKNSNSDIHFYFVDKEIDNQFLVREGDRITVETYYRFLAVDFVSKDVSKVLYIDSDIICNGNITDIFEMDLTGSPAACVYDVNMNDISRHNRLSIPLDKEYFNMGVMLLNLDYWRQNSVKDKLIQFLNCNKYDILAHDQDTFNGLYHDKIISLSPKYNFQIHFFNVYAWKNKSEYPVSLYASDSIHKAKWGEIEESSLSPALIHFIGNDKPWEKECKVPFTKVWRYYYNLSSYHNIKIKSKYKSFFKRFRVLVHNVLARLGLYPEIPATIFVNKAYQIEEDVLLNLK